jgi:hypothetical protein
VRSEHRSARKTHHAPNEEISIDKNRARKTKKPKSNGISGLIPEYNIGNSLSATEAAPIQKIIDG